MKQKIPHDACHVIMEAKVQKQIIDYFSYFEEFHNAVNSSLKDCQKCAISINKQIVRCKNIKEAEIIGTPLEDFAGLQSKLCARIYNLISDEVLELRSHLSTLEDLFEKLCDKHKTLTEFCKDIDCSEKSTLVSGSPLQPPLKQLLEFSEDSLSFGGEICAQLETSLSIIIFKTINTTLPIENFKVPAHWQKRAREIIAYTSFCTENQI